jgi:hypothetical protein
MAHTLHTLLQHSVCMAGLVCLGGLRQQRRGSRLQRPLCDTSVKPALTRLRQAPPAPGCRSGHCLLGQPLQALRTEGPSEAGPVGNSSSRVYDGSDRHGEKRWRSVTHGRGGEQTRRRGGRGRGRQPNGQGRRHGWHRTVVHLTRAAVRTAGC